MSFKIEGYTTGWMNPLNEWALRGTKRPELENPVVISDIALTELEDLRMTEYQIPLDSLEPEYLGYL